jgi:glycosyltransferase involved in cell wall biosynthesis
VTDALHSRSTRPLLNVCAVGDPRSPGVWSGTAANLSGALERAGHLGRAISTRGPRPLSLVLNVADWLAYGREHQGRGPTLRTHRALNAARLTARSPTRDTLHFTTASLPFPGRRPAGQRHFLYVDATWEQWGAPDRIGQGWTERLRRVAERLERRAFAQVEHVFVTGANVRDSLTGHYGVPADRVSVAGTGHGSVTPFTGEKDYGARRLLFVAKDRFEDKGGPLLLDAFRIARQADPRLTLDLVGQGHRRDEIPPVDGLTVHGYLAKEELRALFERASLFTMPAPHEPWGLVYLEALVCRTPILGLARNAFPELSGDGAYGYTAADTSAEAVARTIVEACADPAELARRGAAGQAHTLSTYTWDLTARRIVDVVSTL